MKKNTVGSSKKTKETAHRRITKKPAVQRAIRKLAKEWNDLDRVQRGESLCALIEAGCSQRGLEKDLGQSATSIRRFMTIAKLPELDRAAVRAGKSAKTILALKAQEERQHRVQQRIAEDEKTGAVSDKLVDEVLKFCETESRVYGNDQDTLTLFFNEVRNSVTRLESSGEPVPKARRSFPLKQRFELTRPRRDKEEAGIAHLARWLALFLRSEAPERPILDRAIEKAQARGNEVRVFKTRTGRQAFADAVLKYASLSASPPPRKISAKGARALRGSY